MSISQSSQNSSSESTRQPNMATSFRRDEVELMCSIFAKSSTGTDVSIMLRSAAAQRLHRKFLGMRERALADQER